MLDRGYKRFRISLMNNNSLQRKNHKLTHTKFYLRQYELSKSDVFRVQDKQKPEKHQLQNRFERRSIEVINSNFNKNDSFYSQPSFYQKAQSLKKNKKYIPLKNQSFRQKYELDLLGRNQLQQDDCFPLIKVKKFILKKRKTSILSQNSLQKYTSSGKYSANYGPWQNPQQSNLQIHEYM